ncbi:hypothetical protein SKAU_G00276620 [Synaphobranchus kaupii]|uniref:GTPase IMAP family member 8 n=1 Tax=Synaphobranchus kaupii TaxID=118154 RepID=A0A9Q1F1E6_SYNKA|nr:hypothetical protein SKAU_G00276620 [Synaphobranchus kaupii]
MAELKLMLVGMSGVGKSAAGNTILGREEFKSDTSPSSLTLETDGGEGEVCGRRVTVVDTPGLDSTELPKEKLREKMQTAVALCDRKPHAVLLVIQLGRFTEKESRVMEILQELFSTRVNEYTMVLFTYGDRLKKKTIDEFISTDTNLQQLLRKCGNRYHVFNNQQMENSSQVSELLKKIDEMVTTEMKTTEEGGLKERRRRGGAEGKQQSNEWRIVLVGKTGVGNCEAGNTILGREEFEAELSSSSVTSECRKERGEVDGREVVVVNTPGLFDKKLNNDQIIKQCISMSSPGPHVFLLVIQLDTFKKEEQKTVEIIQEIFSAELAKYTMVLFTHGDKLKGKTIEDFLSKSKELAEFTDKCRGGYHVFNNEDKQKRSQVTELLKKIDKMVRINGGGCYTNEMYEKAEAIIIENIRIQKQKEAYKEFTNRELEEMAQKAAYKAMQSQVPVKKSKYCFMQ